MRLLKLPLDVCRKYGTRIPPNLVRTAPILAGTPSCTLHAVMEHRVPHFHPTPIFPSAFLILICIKKHPRTNGSTQSRSVSLQRTHNAGESSPGGTRRDGDAGSADITQPVAVAAFSLSSSFQ
ncbi:uncharacterized protein TrAtP1_006497 [Trichoderma atroviride]|uniref:uncharacterized protein n=1 Tax=Hypocrea atroviridis TaxID=63577 RepID=UPI00331FD69F|nr:hypothetical protein TrAtP1_006497 [Trichoderma atroviride]